jgi:hypothetical protein
VEGGDSTANGRRGRRNEQEEGMGVMQDMGRRAVMQRGSGSTVRWQVQTVAAQW